MGATKAYRIALLFNANKTFDREVLGGIADYLGSTRVAWEVFLEEDFCLRLAGIGNWQGDGIIADFDDPGVAVALADCQLPVVAVGGSYAAEDQYPPNVPYVATDNFQLVKQAREHLIDVGLQRFAMFSLPEAPENRWAQEREHAFRRLMWNDRSEAEVFRGCATAPCSWDEALHGQVEWLRSLPKPIGIIAVTDARARQLLQACNMAGIAVPGEVALVGIDNDPLVRLLTPIPLTSVMHGAREMGRTAAHLLSQKLHRVRVANTPVLVPPAGIKVLASSLHQAAGHPLVMRACYYIRQHACESLKSHQVAMYLGVSRSSLEAYFRQELGCSVHDVVLRYKLEAAKAGLDSGERSIAEVALGCGFGSTQYMHLVFKRELGCTPRAYRDREFEVPELMSASG
ncbi:DNA-binding transcriptional regulator [Rugamonas sp. A1-17]|nr:DNA-binding transcriptional regulator [Rugamonas sp. A1-17]